MKKTKSIPVNPLIEKSPMGIVIGKISSDNLQAFEAANYSHRHDYHLFLIAEKGTTYIEIDFEKYEIKTPGIIYIHPDQVHRVVKIEHIDVHILGITSENLNPEYLRLLENIKPAKPLQIEPSFFSTLSQSISLCLTLFENRHERLYPSLLKDCCNTLLGLIISQYLKQTTTINNISRWDIITNDFKSLLDQCYITIKRPTDYALAQNISAPYLNECVRNTTGFPVSYHIQQRIVLEAKRLLYHSDKSVKEIAHVLGYDDYAYFSRLFNRVTGMTASDFRNKNLE